MREEENYWRMAMRRRLTRRAMLGTMAKGGAGIVGISLLGCNSQQTAQPTATTGAAAKAPQAGATTVAAPRKPQGKITLADNGTGFERLDPQDYISSAFIPIAYSIYDGLAEQNVEGQLGFGLATKWETAPDNLSWKFTLRPGVKFHNGDPLTSEDVAYSFQRYSQQKETSALGGPELAKLVSKVETPDSNTIIFYTSEPSPILPDKLCLSSYAGWVMPKKYIQQVGDKGFKEKPVGTGPFKITQVALEKFLEFEAVEEHWRKVSNVKTVVHRAVPEPTTGLAMLKAGEADIARIPAAAMDDVKNTQGLRVVTFPIVTTTWLAFCDQKKADSPQANVKVRQALNYAVDKKALVDKLLYGAAEPGNGVISPFSFGYDTSIQPYPYDPKKAKALLAEAGYPNGFDAGNLYPLGPAEQPTMEAVQGYLSEVGVKTKIVLMDTVTYINSFREKKLTGLGSMQSNVFGDGSYRHRTFTVTDGGYSYASYPELDDMYKKQETMMDAKAREQVLFQMMKRSYDLATHLYMFRPYAIFGVNKRIKEWTPMKGFTYFLPMEQVVLTD